MTVGQIKEEAEKRGWDNEELAKRTGYSLKVIASILNSPYYTTLSNSREQTFTEIFEWDIDRGKLEGLSKTTLDSLAYAVAIKAIRDYCMLLEGMIGESTDCNIKETENFFTDGTFELFVPSMNGKNIVRKLRKSQSLRKRIISKFKGEYEEL